MPPGRSSLERLYAATTALSGALDFAGRKALPWRLAFRIALPTTIGSLIGAFIAEIVPRRDMGMVVTAAVLLAMLLLFKNIKKAIEQAQSTMFTWDCASSRGSSAPACGSVS